jgi:hypothetical protein
MVVEVVTLGLGWWKMLSFHFHFPIVSLSSLLTESRERLFSLIPHMLSPCQQGHVVSCPLKSGP